MRSDCGDGEKGGKLNVTTRGVVAYVAGAKREWGGGEGETLSPQSPSFSHSSLSPTPFDACYAG